MLRLISRALVALALLGGPALAQSFTLPEIGLQNSGACRQLAVRNRANSNMAALGCLDTAANGWTLTPNALQAGGADGAAPTMQGLGYQLKLRRYLTGTTATGVNASLVNVEGDNAAITGGNFGNYFTVQGNMSDPNLRGGRQAIQAQIFQTAPTSALNENRNYVAGFFGVNSSVGDGGTGLTFDPTGAVPNTAKGAYFGINPLVVLKAGATNVLNASAGEVNIAVQTGATVAYKSGIQIAQLDYDRVQGAVVDAAIVISNQLTAPGWKRGIDFGTMNGQWPFTAQSTIIRAAGGQVATALDFSGVGLTDSLLKGPSGAILDNTTSFQFAQGGSVLLSLVGGSGMGSIALIGQAGLPPYWRSNGDFTIRSTGQGTLDMNFPTQTTAPTAGGAAALPATPAGYATIKINGTARLIPFF